MVTIQKILLATDFSETSGRASEHAVALAEAFHASLHVIHVLETEIPVMTDGVSYLPPNYFEEIERRSAEQLEETISLADRERIAVTRVMRRGSPFLEIIRYAEDQKMDLIVLGTHGRGALAHLFMGNVAERVVRKAPCAVLTVRLPEAAAQGR